jgi:lysophospholipase L1-like esterase
MLGFQGKATNITGGNDPQGRNFFQQWEVVAERIANLPAAVKQIAVVLLPKVGAVAALLPTSSDRVDGYSEAYVPRLLPSSKKLSGNVVADADKEIQSVNGRIRAIFQKAAAATNTESRLHFIDTFKEMDELDYKNRLSPQMRIRLNDSIFIDNRYLDGALDFSSPRHSRLKAGGYLSIDGMHPSGVGYADLASKVMKALNLPHDRDRLLDKAFQEDPLLSNYPLELDAITRYIDFLRPFNSANWFVAESPNRLRDNTHFSQALKMLSKPFAR